MMNNNGLTDTEYFRMHGTLPVDRIESLIEIAPKACEAVKGIAHLDEARASFPGEDFMENLAELIRDVHKRVKGDNKIQLGYALELVENIRSEVSNSADYGRDELRKLRAILGAME